MVCDIVIIGAGPAGMALACSFANSKVKIAIVEKKSKKSLDYPEYDGREIALTNRSVEILKDMGVWKKIPKKLLSPIREAWVLNGSSEYRLDFKHRQIQKECLGYIVPNNIIKKYLYNIVKSQKNVKLINGESVKSINSNNKKFSTTHLSNGKKINSTLIVASDGRFSKVRSMFGISTFNHDFNKNMVVCKMKHEKSHKNIAYEFFRYSQTQAALPSIKKQSSIVTTVPKDTSSFLMKMKGEKFNKEMEKSFNSFFGKMKLISKRYSYPMVTIYSKQFIKNRFALIGDAAVGMHPVTAHGFNLSLQGVNLLKSEIDNALKKNIDFGLTNVLKKYQYNFHRVAAPLYFGTNGIVNLYSSNTGPAKIAREFILKTVNTIKPIKQAFLEVLK